MKTRKIRFDWKNDTVSYLWPDHPLVIAGNKVLDIVVDKLEKGNDIYTISKTIAEEFNANINEVSEYVELVAKSINHIELQSSTQRESLPKNQSLSMATLNITKKCNLNCIHCYADKSDRNEMTEEQISDVVSKLSKLITNEPKLLILSGGEPTLEPNKLRTAIITARKNGLNPRVNTNGYKIDKNLASFFSENNVLVQVSIDGVDAKTHALLRQSEESFYRAIDSVKCLVASNCRTRISFTVHEKNYTQIPQMLELAESLNVEQFITSNLVNVGNAIKNKLRGLTYAEEFEILYNCVKDNDRRQYMTRSTLLAETITAIRSGIKFSYCGTGCSTCMIDSDGTLFPCINMTKQEYNTGNILNNDLNTIWNNSTILQNLRKLNVEDMNDVCKNCVFRYFCGAFCRGETIEAGGSITSRYIRCQEWKKALNKVLFYIAKSPDLYSFSNEISTGGFYRE